MNKISTLCTQGTMVMVNRGGGSQATSTAASADPELSRLERIPSFLPIMRATLTSGGAAGGANKGRFCHSQSL